MKGRMAMTVNTIRVKAEQDPVNLVDLADRTGRSGSLDEAIGLCGKAIRLAGRQKNPIQAKAMRHLGILYWRKGDSNRAMRYFRRSLAESRAQCDPVGSAQAQNCIGTLYFDSGNWSKVEEYYSLSMKSAKKTGSKKLLAHLYNNLGAMWNIRGDWDRALTSYKEAEVIYNELDDQGGLAKTQNNLGLTHRDKGDWESAATHYKKCIKLAKKTDDEALRANCTLNYIQVLIELSQYEEACDKLDGVLETLRRMGEIGGLAEAVMLSGMILARKGKMKRAERELQKSIDMNEQHGTALGRAECYREMALMYKMWGKNNKTFEYLNRSYEAFKKIEAEKYLEELERQLPASG